MCKDYQEIKIQEQVQHLGMGSMPRGIMVLLLLLLLLLLMMMMMLSLCVFAYTARLTPSITAACVLNDAGEPGAAAR